MKNVTSMEEEQNKLQWRSFVFMSKCQELELELAMIDRFGIVMEFRILYNLHL